MNLHIERMNTELNELELKMSKLKPFLDGENKEPKLTDQAQRIHLGYQLDLMEQYAHILRIRIDYDSNK